MTQNIPDIDNANDGELAGTLNEFLRAWLRDEVNDMMPATVVSYDEASNRAVLRPLVMIGTTGGAKVSRAEVSGIPVYRFGGGGFFIRFPIKAGDLGWIKANDRDISLVLQRGGLEDWPNTKRLHSFSDAMFFPDAMKNWIVDEKNKDAAVFQSLDGSACIAVHSGGKITIKGITEFEDPATFKAGVNFESGGNFQGEGPTHDGVSIGKEHRHDKVQTGTNNSGEVVG